MLETAQLFPGQYQQTCPFYFLFTRWVRYLSIGSTALGVWLYFKGSPVIDSAPELPESAELLVEVATKNDVYVVDVSGAVVHPGVYTLKAGERVAAAVAAAGGVANTADLAYIHQTINLAQPVKDGEKIYIPFFENDSAVVGTATSVADPTRLSLNTATVAELEALPNIGKVTAERIITQRPFSSVEELLTKQVVSEGVYKKIKHLLTN